MLRVHIVTAKDSNRVVQEQFVTLSRENAWTKTQEFIVLYDYTSWEQKHLFSHKGSYAFYKGEELMGILVD